MDLSCEFLSCRTFSGKENRQYFMATFSAAGIGSFELFVNQEQFNQLLNAKYLQSCSLVFDLFSNKMQLCLRLTSLSF